MGNLFGLIRRAWFSSIRQTSTARLNQILNDAVESHPTPLVRGRRIKLRYMHQGGRNPPLYIVHGTQVESLSNAYRRYLMNVLREVLQLEGTPIKLAFKQGSNPFEGKKNTLNQRQISKKRRQVKHETKKSKNKKKNRKGDRRQ